MKAAAVAAIAVLMLTALLAGCFHDTSAATKPNKPPVAVISEPKANSTFPTGTPVTFDGSKSSDPEKKNLTFAWSFGDGAVGTGATANHTYALPGIYKVTLTVSDGKKSATAPVNITVVQANRAPVASFTYKPLAPDTDALIEFNGTNSSDPDGDSLTFSWSFGDTTTGTGKVASHRFASAGNYTVRLTVSDGRMNGTESRNLTVVRANLPPAASFTYVPLAPDTDALIEFNATNSSDPDGDSLAFSWAFGDGATASGAVATHRFTAAGDYNVTLTVSDGKVNRSVTKTVGVVRANHPPAASIAVSKAEANVGDTLTFNGSASSDPDGDSLTYSWSFGDGTEKLVTSAVTVHNYTAPGIFAVTLTVTDAGGLNGTATVNITVHPVGKVLVDWNRTDYGYVVELGTTLNTTTLSATVRDITSGTSANTTNFTLVNSVLGRYRFASTVVPQGGRTLRVEVRHLNSVVAARDIAVLDDSPMPGVKSSAEYSVYLNSSSNRTTDTETSREWMNISGRMYMNTTGNTAERNLDGTGSSGQFTTYDDGSSEEMVGTIPVARLNSTIQDGRLISEEVYLQMDGTGVQKDPSGAVTGIMNMTRIMEMLDKNLTYANYTVTGTGGPFGSGNFSMKYTSLGIEPHANGAGAVWDALKVRSNITMEGYINIGFGLIHIIMYNETTQWDARSDYYENITVYMEYKASLIQINDTTGNRSLLMNESGSAYPDDNGDGIYNPDPKPLDQSAAFTFHGPVPREWRKGDRVVQVSAAGVVSEVVAVDEMERTVGGKTYHVAILAGTYSSSSGNATGQSTTTIINQGNLTGLLLEMMDEQVFTGGVKGREQMVMRVEAVSVREG